MKGMMESLEIKIADLKFLISSKDKPVLNIIKEGFNGFLSVSSKLLMRINIIAREDFMQNPYATGRPHHVNVNDFGRYITVNGNTFTGWLDIKEKRAEVSMGPSLAVFYLFIRFVTIMLLSENKGFIIHATTVAHNGFGYIFAGRPQTGKSTIARLSSDKKVLSDDFSIVKKVNNQFRIFPSPFWGSVRPGGRDEDDSYPIKGIYFLNQSDENFIRPFKSWQKKLSSLHLHILMLPNLRSHCMRVFKLENELINKIPLFKLYFVPNDSIWRCLE